MAHVPLLTVAAPTLLLRATRPVPGLPDGVRWQGGWEHADDVVDVPGDHLSMLEGEHCAVVARVIRDRLRDLDH